MDKDDKYFYPVTAETVHKYAASIFGPIQKGECVTTVWVPMSGRRMWSKFIIENIDLFKDELPYYEKYLLIYIDPLDLTEESLSGYLRLMLTSFIEVCKKNKICKDVENLDTNLDVATNEVTPYPKLLVTLKSVLDGVASKGFETVFFLGEFDELKFANAVLYNNLKSLWSRLYPRLHYVFLMREVVTAPEKTASWGDFNEVLLQNIVYIPILSQKDSDHLIEKSFSELSQKPSQEQLSVIKELCGGHPYMLRVALRVMDKYPDKNLTKKDMEDLLFEHYELRSISRGILDVQNEEQKAILKQVASGIDVSALKGEEFNTLEKLGLIFKGASGKYQVFGKLFEKAVFGTSQKGEVQRSDDGNLKLDKETGAILFDGKTLEEKFTRQEYLILMMFLQNANKLRSRDDIGDALWGKESYEKYSDWAIDQLISKLRKKLKCLGTKDELVTIRGKGYKYIQSAP